MAHWRDGIAGAFSMGARHGAVCLGCCWLLMGLLFVGGVMNLFWIAALTVFVLAEKAFARGVWGSRVAGLAMIAAGAWLFARA
jgi:predicted metal-binding membrane protein